MSVYSLLALLIIVAISRVVVRMGTLALMMTGLGFDAASFQSYSAFFGVGFTTREAELVVNYPIRRRIIRDLILAGNIGLTSAFATLVVTFVQEQSTQGVLQMIGLLLGGVAFLWIVWRVGLLRRLLDRFLHFTLERGGMVRAMDYELLLRVESGYCVSEVEILPGNSLAGKSLKESRPAERGLVLLGITDREGRYRGTPTAIDVIQAGDVVTVYGQEDEIHALSQEGTEDGEGESAESGSDERKTDP